MVTLTAKQSKALTRGLIAPRDITSLTLVHVRSRPTGSWARYFQKLLTSSTLRYRLISSKIARTRGEASAYSIGAGRLMNLSPVPPGVIFHHIRHTCHAGRKRNDSPGEVPR